MKIRIIVRPPLAPVHEVEEGNVYDVLADGGEPFTTPDDKEHPARRGSVWIQGAIEPVRLLDREYSYVKGES